MADEHDTQVGAAEISDLLRLLAHIPVRLAALSRGQDDERLHRPPGDGAWSANEILAHLRACADVWGGSIQAMIERDHPTLRYVSPRTWMRKTRYPAQPFSESLRAYSAQRDHLVTLLEALAPDGWARGATFTGTTRGREQTIESYVRRIVGHEQEHCEQIRATLAQP
jgi:hypothetical protein